MSKTNKLLKINVIVLVLLAVVLVSVLSGFGKAKAETMQKEELEAQQTVEERGLFASLSLSISGGGNGTVIATVRNDFTLGYSTVIVMVELYSSYTYETNVDNMEFEGRNRTEDLDIYQSISLVADTNGEQKYWVAQLEYNQDGNGWKTKVTTPVLYDANGKKVG